ncbi:MAG: glutathione peroxidase [Myxococcota bacterium]|jgi:glutathione peroxidase
MVGLLAACGTKATPAERAEPTSKAVSAASADNAEKPGVTVILDHKVPTLEGETVDLSDYRGKALLVVNTASQCGYTPQYESLQKLQNQYAGKPFTVLAFPSNDFGEQEPGDPAEIRKFVTETYGITFPMFAKTKVKGADKDPLYKTLTEQTADGLRGEVKWNFTKFLVDPEGRVIARFGSGVDPLAAEVTSAIDKALP